jgi:hypothetical protein
MGKKDLAIQYYQFALELDPSIDFATDNLARLQKEVTSADSRSAGAGSILEGRED